MNTLRILALALAALVCAPAVNVWADDALPPPLVRRPGEPAPKAPKKTPVPVEAPVPAPMAPAPVEAPRPLAPSAPAPVPVDQRGRMPAGPYGLPPNQGAPAERVAPLEPSVTAPVAPMPLAPAPSGRIDEAVRDYLDGSSAVITPSGAPGIAGYDNGFWIRGGQFLLRINLTLQARYEAFSWDEAQPVPGGDRSGFSLPRAALKFSGEAPCDTRYYAELDFGHEGGEEGLFQLQNCVACDLENLGPDAQANNFTDLGEAWIEWGRMPALNLRMGKVQLPSTRQLMTPPELQQFADISLASAWVGQSMPGYTDRNRDFGLLAHGAFGPAEAFSYMIAVTNGDGGDGIRNVLDHRTSDNLAYGARLNWAFLNPIGYEESALRQLTCRWYGEVGAWGFYYADRTDRPHVTEGDFLRAGMDLALGYGPWSFTGAFSYIDDSDVEGAFNDESYAWLGQLGYIIPGTAFEIAARASGYENDGDLLGDGSAMEYAASVNYYLNGHGNKLQLDFAYIDTSSDGFLIFDVYSGYGNFLAGGDTGFLIRFQWQLAL